MKTKKFNKKLKLSKESVANLNIDLLINVKGGVLTEIITCDGPCDTDLTCGDLSYCGQGCDTQTFCPPCP
jgi:hypothetical protein